MTKNIEKVVAYVTREKLGEKELLVFAHPDFPEAGIQVPAGTVDPGEEIKLAVLREVQEESGLAFSNVVRYLGRFEWLCESRDELHFRNVFELNGSHLAEDEWFHKVTGHGDDSHLVFRYNWLPIQQAQAVLAAEQGAYLPHLV